MLKKLFLSSLMLGISVNQVMLPASLKPKTGHERRLEKRAAATAHRQHRVKHGGEAGGNSCYRMLLLILAALCAQLVGDPTETTPTISLDLTIKRIQEAVRECAQSELLCRQQSTFTDLDASAGFAACSTMAAGQPGEATAWKKLAPCIAEKYSIELTRPRTAALLFQPEECSAFSTEDVEMINGGLWNIYEVDRKLDRLLFNVTVAQSKADNYATQSGAVNTHRLMLLKSAMEHADELIDYIICVGTSIIDRELRESSQLSTVAITMLGHDTYNPKGIRDMYGHMATASEISALNRIFTQVQTLHTDVWPKKVEQGIALLKEASRQYNALYERTKQRTNRKRC